MIRNNYLTAIAAAVLAATTSVAAAQDARQRTDASQAGQTNPTQVVSPSAATGVQSNIDASGNNNTIRMESSATTNQSTTASQNTGNTQGMSVQPSQGSGSGSGTTARQGTGASQSSQTNPEQYVSPKAATGVQSEALLRGNNNTIQMDSNATTNQSTSASQNTGSTQGMNVTPRQGSAGNVSSSGVPGVSGSVSGGAGATAGGTSSAAGGAVGSNVDMNDGPGKRGKGKAKGHRHAPGQQKR